MSETKLRQQIAAEAARLIESGTETAYHTAKLRAARSLRQGWIPPDLLPDNREIRDQMQHRLSASADHAPFDRFAHYHMLLVPLEGIKLPPKDYPEQDALLHSLQVYELARDEVPYDEELQLAALLHEIGRAIDPRSPVPAALESLVDDITPRTAWLIEHLAEGVSLVEGTLGVRSRKRLESSPDFDDLQLLAQCDRRGRVRGAQVIELSAALDELRELAAECGE
jgi:hypothetical protein